MRLESKTAIVTGGGGHVGRATCLRLAREGAVVYVNDIDADKVVATVELVWRAGGVAHPLAFDVVDGGEVRRAVSEVLGSSERIDILVNVAGGPRNSPVSDMSEEAWDYAVDLNLKGSFNTIREVVPAMERAGGGVIVNTSSTSKNGVPWFAHIGQSNYAAANAGLVGLTRSLCFELAPKGIRINCVVPGPIETDKSRAAFERLESDPDVKVSPLSAIPLGRLAKPDDVAAGIMFLVSDDASYITGTFLNISGGLFG